MKRAVAEVTLVVVLSSLIGCGGDSGGGSSSTSTTNNTNLGYLFGERSGTNVYMQPGPPSYSFPSVSGNAPGIQIDQVSQFSSTVNPEGADIYQSTTQVVFGQITGPIAGKEVVVYSYTNEYYIQPLTSTTINIKSDQTWVAPANAGEITALLVAQGYSAPDTPTNLPAVDGVKVFAITKTGVSASNLEFTGYTVPTAESTPSAIVVGPDSALWFTEFFGNKIGRITASGAVSEYPVPTSGEPCSIAAGPDGALWFLESNTNKIGRITTSGTITEYPVSSLIGPMNSIAAGSDGALWFTDYSGSGIGRLTTSGTVTEYSTPTSNSGPAGIVAGPDGALWFAENTGHNIGRLTTAGAFTEYALPGLSGSPFGITNGPDGALWFTASPGGYGRITTSGAVTDSNLTVGAITTGPDGMMWYLGFTGSNSVLGQFDMSGMRSEYDVPLSIGVEPSAIVTGPDGALWFTLTPANIGRYGPTNSTSQAQLSPGEK